MVRHEPTSGAYVPPTMADKCSGDAGSLAEFLQNRDAPCPQCGYNLRDLTTEACPECGQTLRLTVGVHRPRFGWFLATVTPGLFSGMSAVLLSLLLLVAEFAGVGDVPPIFYLLTLSGFASGLVALVLIVRRHEFIELRPRVQRRWALMAWGVHALPFLGLLVLAFVTS